jgi:hypothetical protein
MKIDIQGIENMLVTSTINDYGVQRKKKKNTNSKRHVSIPLNAHFTLKFILIR